MGKIVRTDPQIVNVMLLLIFQACLLSSCFISDIFKTEMTSVVFNLSSVPRAGTDYKFVLNLD